MGSDDSLEADLGELDDSTTTSLNRETIFQYAVPRNENRQDIKSSYYENTTTDISSPMVSHPGSPESIALEREHTSLSHPERSNLAQGSDGDTNTDLLNASHHAYRGSFSPSYHERIRAAYSATNLNERIRPSTMPALFPNLHASLSSSMLTSPTAPGHTSNLSFSTIHQGLSGLLSDDNETSIAKLQNSLKKLSPAISVMLSPLKQTRTGPRDSPQRSSLEPHSSAANTSTSRSMLSHTSYDEHASEEQKFEDEERKEEQEFEDEEREEREFEDEKEPEEETRSLAKSSRSWRSSSQSSFAEICSEISDETGFDTHQRLDESSQNKQYSTSDDIPVSAESDLSSLQSVPHQAVLESTNASLSYTPFYDTTNISPVPDSADSPFTYMPWSQLRPSAHTNNVKQQTLPAVSRTHLHSQHTGATDATLGINSDTSFRINSTSLLNPELLSKQLHSYRIQIKLFKEFIQRLITANPDVIALNNWQQYTQESDIATLHPRIPMLTVLGELEPESDFDAETSRDFKATAVNRLEQLENENKTLSENCDEAMRLNNEILTNFEAFKLQLRAKELRLEQLDKSFFVCNSLLDEIAQLLRLILDIEEEIFPPHYTNADPIEQIEIRLQAFIKQLQKILIPAQHKTMLENEMHILERQLDRQLTINQDLKQSLDRSREANKDLEQRLQDEVAASQELHCDHLEMAAKFQKLCASLESSDPYKAVEEMETSLRRERSHLQSLNEKQRQECQGHQLEIARLQSELNKRELQASSQGSRLESRSSPLRRADSSRKQEAEAFATISALDRELRSCKEQISTLKAEAGNAESSRRALDNAVAKQRIYKAENVQLSYRANSLSKDKEELRTFVEQLTRKINELQMSADTSCNQQLQKIEQLLGELLKTDVSFFKKLFRSFVEIADEESLEAPLKKIEYLTIHLEAENFSQNLRQNIAVIRKHHRSVSGFFVKAVDLIVQEHIQKLTRAQEEEENGAEERTRFDEEYIADLHGQIAALQSLNDAYYERLENVDPAKPRISPPPTNASPSPLTTEKLRIRELYNRLKAEREARVYESSQAELRLREIEAENRGLRLMLARDTQ